MREASKGVAVLIFFLLVTMFLLPTLILEGGRGLVEEHSADRTVNGEGEKVTQDNDITVLVYNVNEGKMQEMLLETYLVGVLAAEVPALFHEEALKAQAVAARTYTLKRLRAFGGVGCDRGRLAADICTDSGHCQAWLSTEAIKARWPAERRSKYYRRLTEAVHDTRGIVLTYQGMLIDAVYHSNCGGHTEYAVALWGGDRSYLRGVECLHCGGAAVYRSTTAFSIAEFTERFRAYPEALAVVTSSNRLCLEVLRRTSTGRVSLIRIGSKIYEGSDFRRLMGLPSTKFQWEQEGETIIFANRGHGHGVGLCQHGANGAAKAGYTFQEILAHYYSGTRLETVSEIFGIN